MTFGPKIGTHQQGITRMKTLHRIERALVVLIAFLLNPRRDYFPETARRFIDGDGE